MESWPNTKRLVTDMSDDELIEAYKLGNLESHLAGLRAVFIEGQKNALPPVLIKEDDDAEKV